MDQITYHHRLQEARAKARSAQAASVRVAYMDLADFYQRKLDERAPTSAIVQERNPCFG